MLLWGDFYLEIGEMLTFLCCDRNLLFRLFGLLSVGRCPFSPQAPSVPITNISLGLREVVLTSPILKQEIENGPFGGDIYFSTPGESLKLSGSVFTTLCNMSQCLQWFRVVR